MIEREFPQPQMAAVPGSGPAGIFVGTLPAYLDGVFEIGRGRLTLVELFTRLTTLPMIVDMLGALGITRAPLLWGHAPLDPKQGGPGDLFHDGRLEVALLCGSVFPLIVGTGAFSYDAMLNPHRAPAVVT